MIQNVSVEHKFLRYIVNLEPDEGDAKPSQDDKEALADVRPLGVFSDFCDVLDSLRVESLLHGDDVGLRPSCLLVLWAHVFTFALGEDVALPFLAVGELVNVMDDLTLFELLL